MARTAKAEPGDILKNGFGERFVFLGREGRWFSLLELDGDKRTFKEHVRDCHGYIVTGEKVMVPGIAKECNSGGGRQIEVSKPTREEVQRTLM